MNIALNTDYPTPNPNQLSGTPHFSRPHFSTHLISKPLTGRKRRFFRLWRAVLAVPLAPAVWHLHPFPEAVKSVYILSKKGQDSPTFPATVSPIFSPYFSILALTPEISAAFYHFCFLSLLSCGALFHLPVGWGDYTETKRKRIIS